MKVLVVVVLAFFAVSSLAFADEAEDLRTQYQSVLSALADNINSQKLLIEGFKSTNSTYRSLVQQQTKLQKRGQALFEKLKALENPPEPAVEEPPDK